MRVTKVLENPGVQKSIRQLSNNLGSITKAVEGSEGIHAMVSDPDTGEFSRDRLTKAVARSALSSGTAEKAMDMLLDRPEGQMILNIMNNPALKQRYINNPLFNIPAAAVKDRDMERRFLSEKATAAGTASEQYKRLAETKRSAETESSGAALTQSALQELSSFGPMQDINPAEVLKIAEIKAGRALTPAERRVIRENVASIKNKAYNTDALSVVYANRRGGLAGQRSLTALRASGKRTAETGNLLQAATGAEQEARSILKKIMDTRPPERTDAGPRVNIKKLMQMNRPAKEAGYTAFSKYAGDSEDTLLDSLTGLSVTAKPKVRILVKRNFDEENGLESYINDNYLSAWHKGRQPVTRLKTLLRKAKADMSIDNKEVDVFRTSKMFS